MSLRVDLGRPIMPLMVVRIARSSKTMSSFGIFLSGAACSGYCGGWAVSEVSEWNEVKAHNSELRCLLRDLKKQYDLSSSG